MRTILNHIEAQLKKSQVIKLMEDGTGEQTAHVSFTINGLGYEMSIARREAFDDVLEGNESA